MITCVVLLLGRRLEWIRLKKLYLKLQKQEMSKIKKAYSDVRLTSSTCDNDGECVCGLVWDGECGAGW